jgi:hypothetical protein
VSVAVTFGPRVVPLAPMGVVARGSAAAALARSLRARGLDADDTASLAARAARLTVARSSVAGGGAEDPADETLCVLGPRAELPWADGAVYVGREPGTTHLYLPIHRKPSVPAFLLERKLLAEGRAPPIIFLDGFPDGRRVILALGSFAKRAPR